jgi:hypothetical protein
MSRNLSFVFNSAALPVNNHFEGLFLAAFAHLEDNTISLLALDVLFFSLLLLVFCSAKSKG